MRSLYWLTAITLVAAAITTVAIADYGRRHPGSLFGWSTPAQSVPSAEPQAKWVAEHMTDAESRHIPRVKDRAAVLLHLPAPTNNEAVPGQVDRAVPGRIPELPKTTAAVDVPALGLPSVETPPSSNPVIVSVPSIPSPSGIVDEVPEHKQLRESTLGSLKLLQEPSALSLNPICPVETSSIVIHPPATEAKSIPAVVDEFSFPGKEIPQLPPGSGSTSFASAAEPPLPAPQANFAEMKDFQPEGAEVMPGLRVAGRAKPQEDDLANPVRDCLWVGAELVELATPTFHLMALPVRPKRAPVPAPAVQVTSEKKCAPCDSVAAGCCSDSKKCCSDCPDIVIRTYSIAEFLADKSTTPESMIRLVTQMVAPENWGMRDSNIEYFPQGKCLVVRHRSAVQTEVAGLLSQLRTEVLKEQAVKVTWLPVPVIRHEASGAVPVGYEMVPFPPMEGTCTMPRVITDEPFRCYDDDFFGLAPMSADGRLIPIPTSALEGKESLLPAGFTPMNDGPAGKADEKKAPGYFPLYLPVSPLPVSPMPKQVGDR
jgi:hypothetical protein